MKNINIILFFTFGCLVQTNVFAQNNREIFYIHQSVRFKENDIFLNDEGKALIDTIFNRIIAVAKDTISFFDKRDWVLQAYTTIEERNKNNYIGMQRSIMILDYIEGKYNIDRKKFYIRDFKPGSSTEDPEVHFVFPRK